MKRDKVGAVTKLVRHLSMALVTVVALAVAGVGTAWWIGMFDKKIAPGEAEVTVGMLDPSRHYATDEVHVIEKAYTEDAVGTLKAASRTEISSRILAAINRINVRAGDKVNKGDVLVELDRQGVQAQLNQAQAALAATQTAVAQAQDDYDRNSRLRNMNPGAISEQAVKNKAFELESAKANENRAEQALTEAKVNLSYTTIEAPKSGTIIETYAEEGDTARPGEPLLALYDPKSLRLEVPVMENLAIKLRVGDELTVHIDALGNDGKDFKATVDEKVPQAEAASRSFLVKVSLPPSPDLFEGMYGRLEIPAGTRRHLCLATSAIETIGQLEFVYVVGKDGKPEKRFIKTGRLGMPGRVEVLSGLEGGERVLLVGQDETPAES